MTNVADYTTEELERLTTLTCDTRQVKPGEFIMVRGNQNVFMRTSEYTDDRKKLIRKDGRFACAARGVSAVAVRRVRSFTDPTELDPPQEAMLAELERRRRPVISNATHAGRKVRIVGGTRVATLLDNVSALRHQRGYEASYHISGCPQYVWAMYNNGYIGGNLAEDWELVS